MKVQLEVIKKKYFYHDNIDNILNYIVLNFYCNYSIGPTPTSKLGTTGM